MKKYIDLRSWDGSSRRVALPDGTEEVAGVIVSGDEILVYPCYCDPNMDSRTDDFLDGSFCRIWKDGKWVDKEDYIVIDLEED